MFTEDSSLDLTLYPFGKRLFIWMLWPAPISQPVKGKLWPLVSPTAASAKAALLWLSDGASQRPGRILISAEMDSVLLTVVGTLHREKLLAPCCAPVNWSELERMRQIQKSSLASQPFSVFPLLPSVLGKESLLPHKCL